MRTTSNDSKFSFVPHPNTSGFTTKALPSVALPKISWKQRNVFEEVKPVPHVLMTAEIEFGLKVDAFDKVKPGSQAFRKFTTSLWMVREIFREIDYDEHFSLQLKSSQRFVKQFAVVLHSDSAVWDSDLTWNQFREETVICYKLSS